MDTERTVGCAQPVLPAALRQALRQQPDNHSVCASDGEVSIGTRHEAGEHRQPRPQDYIDWPQRSTERFFSGPPAVGGDAKRLGPVRHSSRSGCARDRHSGGSAGRSAGGEPPWGRPAGRSNDTYRPAVLPESRAEFLRRALLHHRSVESQFTDSEPHHPVESR